MSRVKWRNPPPVVAIGGTEPYLVGQEIRHAILLTQQTDRTVVWAETDAEVVDALSVADTFGNPCLIIAPLSEVDGDTIREIKANQPKLTGLLLRTDEPLDEKKFPVLSEIHAGFQIQHNIPATKKDQAVVAVRFARAQSDHLLRAKGTLDPKLAEAIVGAVGTDLGTLAFEVSKMTALARSQGVAEVTVEHVRSLIRRSSSVDMEKLRSALKERDTARVAAALDLIRRSSPTDPVMLLLRAKGGPADLALTWLRAALLLEKGADLEEISARTGTPEWATKRDVIPAARRWGVPALRDLVKNLSRVDRGVLLGSPSPWVSCESALLIGCAG